MEKYSRGWRGAPAKGVGRVTGARVQIPLSPLFKNTEMIKNKKVVDKDKRIWYSIKAVANDSWK